MDDNMNASALLLHFLQRSCTYRVHAVTYHNETTASECAPLPLGEAVLEPCNTMWNDITLWK